MKNKRLLSMIMIFTILFLFTSCSDKTGSTNVSLPEITQSDSDFQFKATDLDGNEITDEIFSKSKLTVINFWATYCSPCIKEMPALAKLADEYNKEDLQIIGVVIDVTKSNGEVDEQQVSLAKEIVNQTGAKYTHIIPSRDFNEMLANVSAVPTTLFLDSNGRIITDAMIGMQSEEDWKATFDKLLSQIK